MPEIGKKTALIVVDIQKDFLPGGNLAVPDGDKIIPIVNEYIQKFEEAGGLIVATRDWHPVDHISFKERGGPWPPHCIQNTDGAKFHDDLKLPENTVIISKADEPDKEAYSGFQGTELQNLLKEKGIDSVFVCGLATEYCVKNTVLDAIKLGFKTHILADAIKGIDANPGDSEKAIEEMKSEGAEIVNIKDVTITPGIIQKTIESVVESIEAATEKPRKELRRSIKRAKKEVGKILKRYGKKVEKASKQIGVELSRTIQKVADIIKETSEKVRAGERVKIKKPKAKVMGKKKPASIKGKKIIAPNVKQKVKKISQRGKPSGGKRKGKGGGKPMATKKAAAGKKKTATKKKK